MAFWTRNPKPVANVDAAVRQALIAVLDHEPRRAEELLSAAVRRDSSAIEAYLALGRLYRGEGEIGRAIQVHQNLLLRSDLDADGRFEALVGLADDFREGGFLRRSIAAYEEVLTLRPKHPGALRALVTLLLEVREAQRAIPLARRLAKLEGRDAGVAEAALWVEVAQGARTEGRTEEARKALGKALRRDKRSAAAWCALGEVEAELGRPKKALAAWRRVPGLDRRAAGAVYAKLAATWAALDKSRDFERFVEELLEEQPDDATARLAFARALAARGACDDALAQVRLVLDAEPERLEAHALLGRILLGEGRAPDAVKALEVLLDVLERQPAPVRSSDALS